MSTFCMALLLLTQMFSPQRSSLKRLEDFTEKDIQFLRNPIFKMVGGKLGVARFRGTNEGPLVWFDQISKKAVQIETLNQLKGKVVISNTDSALQYLRLSTSPRIWMKRNIHEVVATNWINNRQYLGNEGYIVSDGYLRVGGVITEKECRSLGVSPAKVQVVSGGYRISRIVLDVSAIDGSHSKVQGYRFTEFVGSDGAYALEKRQAIPSKNWDRLFHFGRRTD